MSYTDLPKGWNKCGVYHNATVETLIRDMKLFFDFSIQHKDLELRLLFQDMIEVRDELAKEKDCPYFGGFDSRSNAISRAWQEIYLYGLSPDEEQHFPVIDVQGIARNAKNPFFRPLTKEWETYVFDSVQLELEASADAVGLKGTARFPFYLKGELEEERKRREDLIRLIRGRIFTLSSMLMNFPPEEHEFLVWAKELCIEVLQIHEFGNRLIERVKVILDTIGTRYMIAKKAGVFELKSVTQT